MTRSDVTLLKNYPKLNAFEVMGKTKRISMTRTITTFKLGLTNKEVLPSFNFFKLFWKKKAFLSFSNTTFLQYLTVKSAYTKNGLFSKTGFRILRVGKLSTFK